MPSIKRNSRTNLILDREQRGDEMGKRRQERGKAERRGREGREMEETFVKNRAHENFTVGICRCLGDRELSRELANGHAYIVIFTTSARQKKRLFAMVRCAAMTVVRVKLVTMLPLTKDAADRPQLRLSSVRA